LENTGKTNIDLYIYSIYYINFVVVVLLTISADEYITSLAEFLVYKVSERHSEPVRRILCLSEVCLLERDPASYSICTLKPLGEVK